MKVCLVCIGRLENKYIREYIEHYNNLGVDKIFLYDNNYDGEERFEDVIDDYISEGLVDVIDYRNKSYCQLEAYEECYNLHRNEYDWFIFADCGDEYLYLEGFDKISDFLRQSKFDQYDVIHVNRMMYGDNGLVEYDDRKLVERFPEPIMPFNAYFRSIKPENDNVSSIVRGGLANCYWRTTPHTPTNVLRCCDAAGNKRKSISVYQDYDFTCAHFKHYITKTIQEWLEIKVKRGYPDKNKDYFQQNDALELFFKCNEKTDEKMEMAHRILGE